MWNVNPKLDDNYGPEFGVDYARFSDPPDYRKDFLLRSHIEEQLPLHDQYRDVTLMVRNGFVILKGNVSNLEIRNDVAEFVRSFDGVVEVINQIQILPH